MVKDSRAGRCSEWRVLLTAALLFSLFLVSGFSTDLVQWQLGPTTAAAWLCLITITCSLFIVCSGITYALRDKDALLAFAGLIAYLLLLSVHWVRSDFSALGQLRIRNDFLAITTLACLLLLAAYGPSLRKVADYLSLAIGCGAIVYLVGLGTKIEPNTLTVYTTASLPFVAWLLARFISGHLLSVVGALLIFATTLFMLSRIATLAQGVMFTLAFVVLIVSSQESSLRVSRAFWLLGSFTVVACVVIYLNYDFFSRRMFGGDRGINLGLLSIHTSGRAGLWGAVFDSWQTAPLFGHGIAVPDGMVNARGKAWSHPHNDLLRVLHQVGLIGFLGFALFVFALGRVVVKSVRRATSTQSRIYAHAAALAVTGWLVMMLTDNVLVYPWVALPTVALVVIADRLSREDLDSR